MSDQSIFTPGMGPEAGGLSRTDRTTLAQRTVYIAAAVCALLIGLRFLVSEGGWATILHASFVTAAIGAVVLLISRSLLLATVLATALVVQVSIASSIKLKYMNLVLHAYDLAYYLTTASTLAFLWENYRTLSLAVVAGTMTTAVAGWLAWRVDPTRVSRLTAACAAVVFMTGGWLAASAAGDRRHTQFEYQGMWLTSFYRSWSETVETLWRGQLLEAAPKADGPPLALAGRCQTAEKPPHVILIHHESIVQPSLFPQLAYDPAVDRFFQSDDGKTHKLRVETYGGASTLTEFSVLTGLSTYAFGGMRQFVQWMMSDKVKETLPQVLTSCGYRNVLFYPMLKSFTFADKFFKGVGIDEIFDSRDQKATRVNERDRFYYDNAVAELGRHLSASDKPMFTFIETMATHWPYDKPYEPHLSVPGGGPGTHPEMHEYLRRLAISRDDYDHLVRELKVRFPKERFLIVRYGDHHPMATRMLLGFKDGTEAEDVRLDPDSIGFITFFAVNGVNIKPKPYGRPPVLDVAYLSTVLLEAAGLPLPDSYKRRQQLMAVCEGRSFGCARRDQVLGFHRQLLDAGLVSAR